MLASLLCNLSLFDQSLIRTNGSLLKNKRVNNPDPKVHVLYLKVLPVKYNESQTVLSRYCDSLWHHVWDEVWLHDDGSLIIYEMCLFSDKHHYFYSFFTVSSLSVDLLNQVICVSKKYLTATKLNKYKIHQKDKLWISNGCSFHAKFSGLEMKYNTPNVMCCPVCHYIV